MPLLSGGERGKGVEGSRVLSPEKIKKKKRKDLGPKKKKAESRNCVCRRKKKGEEKPLLWGKKGKGGEIEAGCREKKRPHLFL